jgi:hypothetical protein
VNDVTRTEHSTGDDEEAHGRLSVHSPM